MADGLLEEFLGSASEEDEEIAADSGVDPVDETARALALERGAKSTEVDRETVAFLRKQGQMLDIQMEHLHEQRGLNLRHMRVRRWRETLQLGTQVFIALVAAVAGIGLLVMLYDAFTTHSVVVNAFKTPSALAARGLSGDVVGSEVLDELEKLQEATRGFSKGLATRSAWASDIKIEVPETGVSIGEIDRLLHERLGHDVHIDGDLVQTDANGLELTVRGDSMPAASFQGAPGDLAKMTRQAAEYIYGRSQPMQFVLYLTHVNRPADALAVLPRVFADAKDDKTRAAAAATWGNAFNELDRPAEAVPKYRLALSLDPPGWVAWGNLVGSLPNDEAQWLEGGKLIRAVFATPRSKRPELRVLINAAQHVWDLPLLLDSQMQDLKSYGGGGTSAFIIGPGIADTYGLMHDPISAERYIAASDPDDPTTQAEAALLAAYAARDRGDFNAALPPLRTFWTLWQANAELQSDFTDPPCLVGLVLGMTGHTAEAAAVFKRAGPLTSCYAAQGDVLAHAGDLSGANKVWAAGIAAAPDMPLVYLQRGRWEMGHGAFKAAEADLSTAAAKAPHFADPLKAWGDLLAQEGRWKAALAEYDAALKSAPAWIELHQARAAAAGKA